MEKIEGFNPDGFNLNYHAIDTFAQVHQDPNRYLFIRGPVGSGKSSGCIWHCVLNAMKQVPDYENKRKARYAVLRATYPSLKTTVVNSWKNWFGPLIKVVYDIPIRGTLEFPFHDGTTISIELLFIALDREEDVNKLQSLELTGAHINEVAEVQHSGVFNMLKTRIRRFPEPLELVQDPFIILDYNSPDTEHWLYKLAEEQQPPEHSFYHQPPALIFEGFDRAGHPKYSNNRLADNWGHIAEPGEWLRVERKFAKGGEWVKHLHEKYYLDMVHGSDPAWINVFLLNNYGMFRKGKPVYPEYDDKYHCPPGDVRPLQGVPITIGMDLGLCYTDDHEVLTKSGWKFFQDVDEVNDLVATKNPITKEMEYTPINFKVEEDHDGEMLEWDSQNVSMCVTPEHIVPFTCRDTPNKIHFNHAEWLAQNMGGHHFVDLTSKWNGIPQESPVLKDQWSFETYCKFMGWFLSEGSVEKNTNRVCITQKNKVEELKLILKETGLSWKLDNINYRCSNKELASYLKQFGKSKDKFIPQEVKNSIPYTIELFIKHFTYGDGHKRIKYNGAEEHIVFSKSKQLMDDIQELAQKVGWGSSLSYIGHKTHYYKSEDRYIISSPHWIVRFKKKAKRAELLKANFKRVYYKGKRYCLNVPYHTLLIRRHGRVHWNGNTPAAAFTQLTPMGQLQVFDELVEEDMSIKKFCRDRLIPHIATNYRKFKYTIVIDPSGSKRGDAEAKSAYDIMRKMGLPIVFARTNEPLARREAVVYFLAKRNGFQLSSKCKILRKGFISEYHYPKYSSAALEGRYKPKPDKNMYSHIHDGLQYACLELSEGRSIRKKAKFTTDIYNGPATNAGY